MEVLGKEIPGFKFPVCTAFRPRNLFGQLCYEIDMNQFEHLPNLTNGAFGGLSIALDYNEKSQLDGKSEKEVTLLDSQKTLNDIEMKADNRFTVKVYIETLEPYVGFGVGRYLLNSVKQIIGTKKYIELAPGKKVCQTEQSVSECFEKRFSKSIIPLCGCKPFELSSVIHDQVCSFPIFLKYQL